MMTRTCLTALAPAANAAPVHAAVVNQWVQSAPDDTVLLRAIEDTPANGCPAALVDGGAVALSPRGDIVPVASNAKSCWPVLDTLRRAVEPALHDVRAVAFPCIIGRPGPSRRAPGRAFVFPGGCGTT